MHETRRVVGTWTVLTGCLLSLLCGCGVQWPGTSGTNGTNGSGGSGGTGGAPAPAQVGIAVTPASLAFGNVNLNTTTSQTVAIESTGNASLQITALTVSGSGYALSPSPALPINVSPGATYTVAVAFTPTAAGSATGELSLASNAANAPAVTMSGAGIQPIAAPAWVVDLTWQAPADSGDPVAGFNVYRAASGTGAFGLLNSAPVTTTAYADASVTSGNWDYVVRSVDASGATSAPSNVYTAAIP